MNTKNLIIAAVGDNSLHKEWISGDPSFDMVLIYYGDNESVFVDYAKDARICIRQVGQKYPLIKSFIERNRSLLSQYEYAWLPDDDISLSTEDLNRLFDTARRFSLQICQPALISLHADVSHAITRPRKESILRFTNFVEVMMPLFDVGSLLTLCDDFDLSQSGWGLDATWFCRLTSPRDKMAIVDEITAVHTKPVGKDYSRFKTRPEAELERMLRKYDIRLQIKNLSSIWTDGSHRTPWHKKIFRDL